MDTPLFLPNVAPYSLSASDKERYLLQTLNELRRFHRERCPGYALLTEDMHADNVDRIVDYPFVPVSVFKEFDLHSSQGDLAVIKSSSTTSNSAAKIYVDKESRKRQTRSANLILGDYIGHETRPYLVFDLESTVRGTAGFSARGAAIMALAHMASEFIFVMKDSEQGPVLDTEALKKAVDKIDGRPFISYGFTYMLYQAHEALRG
ncbi:MAG: hypothetical protein AAGC71_15195, partial [Pseudomonadota bacterium]